MIPLSLSHLILVAIWLLCNRLCGNEVTRREDMHSRSNVKINKFGKNILLHFVESNAGVV